MQELRDIENELKPYMNLPQLERKRTKFANYQEQMSKKSVFHKTIDKEKIKVNLTFREN
jgi:hypothetical protein